MCQALMTGGDSNRSPSSQALLGILGALGTGLGVLGFVTFVGGVTWLARYRGAHLSGTYSVGLLPHSELLSTGADQLFAPAVAAAVAVLVALAAFFVCRYFERSRKFWIVLIGILLAAGLVGAAQYFWHETANDRLIGVSSFIVLSGLAFLALLVLRPRIVPERIPSIWALVIALVLLGLIVAADIFWFLEIKKQPTYDPVKTVSLGVLAALLLGAGVTYWLGWRAYGYGPEAKVSGGELAVFVGALLVTVFIYSALETYARNLARPSVRPAAVVRKSAPDVAGIYLGQNSDTFTIGILNPPLAPAGRPEANPRFSARLLSIPRSDIAAFAVGGIIEVHEAQLVAPCLLASLQRTEGEAVSASC